MTRYASNIQYHRVVRDLEFIDEAVTHLAQLGCLIRERISISKSARKEVRYETVFPRGLHLHQHCLAFRCNHEAIPRQQSVIIARIRADSQVTTYLGLFFGAEPTNLSADRVI